MVDDKKKGNTWTDAPSGAPAAEIRGNSAETRASLCDGFAKAVHCLRFPISRLRDLAHHRRKPVIRRMPASVA
jgi:hypothetical protein